MEKFEVLYFEFAPFVKKLRPKMVLLDFDRFTIIFCSIYFKF